MSSNRRVECVRDQRGEQLLTLASALVLDQLLGEPPPTLHPVVWIGRLATAMERRAPAASPTAQLAYGVALIAVVVGSGSGTAALADAHLQRLSPGPRILLRAVLLKPTFAAKELLAAAERVYAPLEAHDLGSARVALRSLVGRDPSHLDATLIAAAAVESLAENASDSIVAPWVAFLAGGLPGAYAYRAANTLDAAIGYHGRYEYLGKPAARCDDLLNVIPARLTAALIVGAAVPHGWARSALTVALRDHAGTSSPNAGWPMSAMAGALGVRLEKIGHYVLGSELRPPDAKDVAAASRLVTRLVAVTGFGIGVAGLARTLSTRRGEAAWPFS